MKTAEGNRFAALRNMKIAPDPATVPDQQEPPRPAVAPSVLAQPPASPQLVEPKPQVAGKRLPKRNDPAYQQVNTYIPITLHRLVWRELVSQHPKGHFDELIETRLRDWLKEKGITRDLDGTPI